MNLTGKRVVVLGGSSGIGLATAQEAAKAGAAIVIASSRQARIDQALTTLPGGSEGRAVDLTDRAAVKRLFENLGPIDHLVFTAGETWRLGSLADTDLDAARRFFTLRYWGAFTAAKYGASTIRPGGSIVFTSGSAGRRPRPGWSLGASVCSAVEGLTRALAVELAPIRVNAVAPGLVKTELWAGMPDAAREGMYGNAAASLPVGHVGEAAEVAQAYLYLMTQTYGTGDIVTVNGGGMLV